MSFLIHLLIFFILPSFSTSSYRYGLIRNSSIKLPFELSNNYTHQIIADNCTDCLCEAYRHADKVDLFTCTVNTSKFLCQFYYFMPKRNEIDHPRSDASIYLMKNKTFEEKDDCCNTTYLLEKIRGTANNRTFMTSTSSRFLVFGGNNTILSISGGKLNRFNRSTLKLIDVWSTGSFSTVGYNDGKYYFDQGSNIIVYDATSNSSLYTITLGYGTLTTIRFLNETQMLVGVGDGSQGVYICEKNSKEENFTKICNSIVGTGSYQVHAIGIVNENAFYVGWAALGKNLSLYTRDQDNTWKKNDTLTKLHSYKTSDIFVDQCQRVWAVEEQRNQIFIYDQTTNSPQMITVGSNLFNLLILEDANYTLVTSEEKGGVSYIQAPVNCRPLRKKI